MSKKTKNSHFTPKFKKLWAEIESLVKASGGVTPEVKKHFRDGCLRLGHLERVSNLFRIKDKLSSKAIFFVPNGPQEQFLRTKKGRDIILKTRQVGFSTLSGLRALDYVLFEANARTGIMSHQKDLTSEMFQDLVKFSYEWFKEDWGHLYNPTEVSDSKTALAFKDDGLGRLLNSSIRVFFAGRGKTMRFLHVSEASRVEDARLAATLQGVPATAEVIYESTPQGRAGDFYRQWQNHETMGPLAPYKGHFFPWFSIYPEQPENWELPEGTQLTPYEETLIEQGLTKAHIAWRRWCIEANCQGDPEIFENEYPSNTYDCFFSGEALVFPSGLLKSQDKNSRPASKVGFLLSDGGANGKVELFEDNKGVVSVWETPDTTASYVIGADPSGGVGKDRGAAWVLNQKNGKFVARLHGQFDPADFAQELIKLATYYNKAWICPEVNNHGHVVIHVLQTKGYRNLYKRKVIDETTNKPTTKVGFVTTNESKILITEKLKTALKEGASQIPDKETISEMSSFVQVASKNNKTVRREASPGAHDDLVIAASLAIEMHSSRPTESVGTMPLSGGPSNFDSESGFPF